MLIKLWAVSQHTWTKGRSRFMYIKSINHENKTLKIAIPLTLQSGKTRVKKRSILNEHGIPAATRSNPMTKECYVEWQIGYDVLVGDAEKENLTTLTEKSFTSYKGKQKYLYELSEYIHYFYIWGIITYDELVTLREYLETLPTHSYFDTHSDMAIRRRIFIEKTINDIPFLYTVIESPLVVHKFDQYEIVTEIEIKEQQRAVGMQPMLYFCFPLTELDDGANLLGRISNAKEEATFTFDANKKFLLIEMLKIFGMLSANHNHDVRNIITLILGECGDDCE